jgi:hypothetical protein
MSASKEKEGNLQYRSRKPGEKNGVYLDTDRGRCTLPELVLKPVGKWHFLGVHDASESVLTPLTPKCACLSVTTVSEYTPDFPGLLWTSMAPSADQMWTRAPPSLSTRLLPLGKAGAQPTGMQRKPIFALKSCLVPLQQQAPMVQSCCYGCENYAKRMSGQDVCGNGPITMLVVGSGQSTRSFSCNARCTSSGKPLKAPIKDCWCCTTCMRRLRVSCPPGPRILHQL